MEPMKSLIRALQRPLREWVGHEWPEDFLKNLAKSHNIDTSTVILALGVLDAEIEGDEVVFTRPTIVKNQDSRERVSKDGFRLYWNDIERALSVGIYRIFDNALKHGGVKAVQDLVDDPPDGWEKLSNDEWVKPSKRKTGIDFSGKDVAVDIRYGDWETFRELANHFDLGD